MAEVVESERVEIMLSSFSEHESDTDVITRGGKRSRSRLSSSENRYAPLFTCMVVRFVRCEKVPEKIAQTSKHASTSVATGRQKQHCSFSEITTEVGVSRLMTLPLLALLIAFMLLLK